MSTLDDNQETAELPPLDPFEESERQKMEEVKESVKSNDNEGGMFSGIVSAVANWGGSIAFVVIGIVFIGLAFLMTDVGKEVAKKAMTKEVA